MNASDWRRHSTVEGQTEADNKYRKTLLPQTDRLERCFGVLSRLFLRHRKKEIQTKEGCFGVHQWRCEKLLVNSFSRILDNIR